MLYIKRKVGACSYVDDPIGCQSLLSRAMHKVVVTVYFTMVDILLPYIRLYDKCIVLSVSGVWPDKSQN